MVADVTAPISGDGQHAYTFIPTADTENLIRSKAVAPAIALAELLKVRMYTAESETGARRLRIVPIGVPGAVMPTQLDSVLDALADELHGVGDSGLRWDEWKPRAKHRLLQMYTSACVAAEFWCDLEEAGAVPREFGRDDIEEGHLRSYFGPGLRGGPRCLPPCCDPLSKGRRHRPRGQRTIPVRPGVRACGATGWYEKRHNLMGELIKDANGRGGSAAEPAAPLPGQQARLGDHKIWVPNAF